MSQAKMWEAKELLWFVPLRTFKFCWGKGAGIHLYQKLDTFKYPLSSNLEKKEFQKPCHVASGGVGDVSNKTLKSLLNHFLLIILNWTMATFLGFKTLMTYIGFAQIKQHCMYSLLYAHYNANPRRAWILVSGSLIMRNAWNSAWHSRTIPLVVTVGRFRVERIWGKILCSTRLLIVSSISFPPENNNEEPPKSLSPD